MKSNVQIDQYAEGYQNALFDARAEYKKELAALRAENAKLREGLKAVMEEMDRIWDEFEIGDEFPRSLGRHILDSTTPDPLYLAAPKMLEALMYCPDKLMHGEFYEAAERCRIAIAHAKGESAQS